MNPHTARMKEKDYYTQEAIDLLCRMIETPSLSRQEEEVASLLYDWMVQRGLHPQRIHNNVWCVDPHFDNSRPTLLLDGHIDTVKPVSGWQYDPFRATREEGCIHGLGSNDDGASVVSLLQTYRLLTERPQPYNLVFSASAEEEIAGSKGIESLMSQLPPIAFAVIGEPTCMQPAIAEKGLMVLDGTAYGKAGHAARNEGVNALYIALEDINRLRSLTLPRVSDLLGEVRIAVTQIQAGTQHNVIPDRCTFVVDVRSTECYPNAELFDILASCVKSGLKARSFRLNPTGLDRTHPFVGRALQLGLTPFGSPTLSNQALLSCPSVKIGPGDSCRSHTANEYIRTEEIGDGIALYVRLLDGLQINS